MYDCVLHVWLVFTKPMRMLDFLGLELPTVASCHVDAGIRTWVLLRVASVFKS